MDIPLSERLARFVQLCVVILGRSYGERMKRSDFRQKEIVKFYEEKYRKEATEQTRNNPARVVAERQILPYLSMRDHVRLLDVACGSGWFLKKAEEWGFETYGVDISTNAISISRKMTNAILVVASGQDLPFRENSFDYVTIFGSLEHFLDMDKGLKEIRCISRPQGGIVILVPNSLYMFGGGTDQPKETLLSLSQWVSLIRSNGLEICAVMQDRNPAYKRPLFEDRKLIFILRRLAQRMIWLITPLSLTCCFLFICRRPVTIR